MLKVLKMGYKGFARQRRNYVSATETRKIRSLKVENVPDVSVSSIRARLVKHEVSYEERTTNFVIGCPSCRRGGKSLTDRAKIFINKRTGAFVCEFCQHTGSWPDIDSYISAKYEKCKDPSVVDELNHLAKYVRDIKRNAIELATLSDDEFATLVVKFGLPPSTSRLRTHELGVLLDITRSNLYFPLKNTLDNVVGYLRLRSKDGKSFVEPQMDYTESSGVVLSRSLKNKETAVVVANVADFLVLTTAAIPYNVICLPNGLVGLSQYILPCFERYTKLVLWFGSDLISWDVARSYTRKLGERRCLLIRPVDKVPLPHVDPNQDFKSVIQCAKPIWHKSITTFASLREDILADLQNVDRVQGVKWTRFPVLNKLLKGHRRGELTVLTGPTGSGKTTFISEYSLDLAMQGVTTLWGSFEIRNARLARTMLQQMAGVPLDEHLEKYDSWADKFEQLPIYYMTFHGQQTIKVVMEAIEHATYVHDISHVIIDNLQFMMGLSEDVRNMDRFWKQDLIISHFRTFATRRNCHVTLVIHPRKEKQDEDLTMSSIFGGAKASQEADNILIVQDKRLQSVRGKSFLQIAKNRYSGDVGVMPLDFDKASLSFVQKSKTKAERQPPQPDAKATA